RPPPFRRPRRSAIGDVRFTIANQRLHVLPGADPDAPTTLPDPAAAHQALSGRAAAPWSTQRVDSTGPYLIYTLPVQLVQPDGSPTPGVLQASISEQQYQHSLQCLLAVLLSGSALGLLAAAAIIGVLARLPLGPIQLALRRQ